MCEVIFFFFFWFHNSFYKTILLNYVYIVIYIYIGISYTKHIHLSTRLTSLYVHDELVYNTCSSKQLVIHVGSVSVNLIKDVGMNDSPPPASAVFFKSEKIIKV